MNFSREDWTLFRNLQTLGQKAGVGRDRLAALVLKEITDNALDAGGNVTLEDKGCGTYAISDDGPGIPGTDEEIAALFSIRRPMTSSKLLRLPTRGALGNGLRVVAGAVLASGGKLAVSTGRRYLVLTPQDDGTTVYERREGGRSVGTRVEITLGPELAGQSDPAWMAKQSIALRGESCYSGRSSAWWYDSDSFYEMFQAFGDRPASALIEQLDLPTRGGSAKELLAALSGATANLLSREAVNKVLTALRSLKAAPAHAKLGVVGTRTVSHQGYAKKTATMTIHPGRGGGIPAEIPVVIEVFAYKLTEPDAKPQANIFVNRTRVTSQARTGMDTGREGQQYIVGCGLDHWFKTGRKPMRLGIFITSPYMPIVSDGKEPNLEPILSELTDAITSATRKAKAATSEGRKTSKLERILEHLIDGIAKASGGFTTGKPGGIHAASFRNAKTKLRYSLRQLFYAIRGPAEIDADDYNGFCKVIAEIENGIGFDLPCMYRDARGSLYHPHTGEVLALGTLAVEQYRRPDWRFNKIIYVEKAGFLPLLIDEKWMERNDCAIVTSQGQATRAVKDVLDMLGDTDEPLEVFCIHDADGYGTLIYESLVQATLARPGRRVKVTNLGLDPWEAQEMGLDPETFETPKNGVPVADYVWNHARGTYWRSFLQTQRYELNAMSSPVFLAWLDEKMAQHSTGQRVVPPFPVLMERYQERAHAAIRERLIADAIRDLGIDAKAERLAAEVRTPTDLDERVSQGIDGRPVAWDAVVAKLANEKAESI